MFGVRLIIRGVRGVGTEVPTFLRKFLAYLHSYNVWPTAGVVIVAPVAGGEGNEREEGAGGGDGGNGGSDGGDGDGSGAEGGREGGRLAGVEGDGGGEGTGEGSNSLASKGGGQMPEPDPRWRAASHFSCRTTLLAIAAVVVLVVGGVLVFGSKHVAMPAGATRDDKAISSTADPRNLHGDKKTMGRPVQEASSTGRYRASKAVPVGRQS
jgi:hypothetical protein